MNPITFEHDRDFVIDAVRQGNLDYLEPVTEAAEGDFFRHILGRAIMDRLVGNLTIAGVHSIFSVVIHRCVRFAAAAKLADSVYVAWPTIHRPHPV